MAGIIKAKETMSAKERVARTFQYERTDRVTIGYEANASIHRLLCHELGISPDNMEGLYDILGVDYISVDPRYTGLQLFDVPKDRMVNQLEGSIMRWAEHDSGGYWDFCDFPLLGAPDEAFVKFPVPNPDDFDYDTAFQRAKYLSNKYALYVGSPGIPDIINSNGRIMGMEDVLCHLLVGNEAVMDFIHRRVDYQIKMKERTLDKCKGLIDFMWLGEDLGTQNRPMISLDLYRRVLKPVHKRFADLAAAFGIPVIVHTCGSSSWVYEEFIEMGIKGVDTLQPEAVNMSPEYLTKHFGGRLNFRGCISTAGPLAYGTVEETTRVCRETLEMMMPHRGYHFAPTHAIQDNSPVENVIAMYQAAHDFGCYR